MITIYTAQTLQPLLNRLREETAKHIEEKVLFLPERNRHCQEEAEFILDNLRKYPQISIYTLSEVAANVVGHGIANKKLNYLSCKIVRLPENDYFHYNPEGYVNVWCWGFYQWDLGDKWENFNQEEK